MKVTAIIGSPHKTGDTYKIVKCIEERMNKEDHVDFDYLHLGDLDLGHCSGCMACFMKGEEFCPKRDTTLALKEKIAGYDGLILASPVYAHHVTALMKNFVDHFSYLFHRPAFVGLPALAVASTGGSGLKETLGYLKFTAVGWGCHLVGELGVMSPFLQVESYRKKTEAAIDVLSGKLLQAMKSGRRPSPSLSDLMFFRGMRCKARMIPRDFDYWREKGWFDQSYFVQVPVSPIKNTIAGLMERLALLAMKRFLGKEMPEQGFQGPH